MGGACSTYGERRGLYKFLMGKPEGKRRLWRSRRRWEDNIQFDLRELGYGGRIILRWIFNDLDVRALTGLIWLRIPTSGVHL